MAKIPFSIKYRPQIESGEYKVKIRDGRPARIICWEAKGCQPIIVLIRSAVNAEEEIVLQLYADGRFSSHGVETIYDLFIVTPESEISEFFEKAVDNVIYEFCNVKELRVKDTAAELLALAKQQLIQSGELLTQEHHEKLMETQYNETLEGVKKNWRDYFTPQAVTDIYNAGRNDALKDLPRWKKATGKERFNERMIVLAGDNDLYCTNYAEEGEYYLPFPILEKLPKEDESHE